MSFIFKIDDKNFLKKNGKYEMWSIYIRIYSVNELLLTKTPLKAFSWICHETMNKLRIPSESLANLFKNTSKSVTHLKAMEG